MTERKYEPKDSIIQRMSARAADMREVFESNLGTGSDEGADAADALLTVVEEFLSAHEEEEEPEPRERGFVVVFDVEGRKRHEGALALTVILDSVALVGKQFSGNVVRSWWFAESEDKHADGNDNADMTLVRRDVLAQLKDAYEQGDAEWMGNVIHRLSQQIKEPAL